MSLSPAALVLSAALAAASPAAPAPASPPPPRADDVCSSDAFTVDGHALTVQICAPAAAPRPEKGKRAVVGLRETVSSGGASFVRAGSVDYLEGAESSRTLDDVPLDKLGIAKTLHLTIGYKPGTVRLEHALLIPGAVPLK
jgi:hypothetical protein